MVKPKLGLRKEGEDVMTKKQRTKFVCQECGHNSFQWLGKCPSCGNWNTFVEESEPTDSPVGGSGAQADQALDTILKSRTQKTKGTSVTTLDQVEVTEHVRWTTNIGELDRVLGGGAVQGGFVLIGGDPGIGKSTLLLQALEEFSQKRKVLYVTGEESPEQVKLRAKRLGLRGRHILLAAETSLEKILKMVEKEDPDVLAIDSIQTMYTETIESAPGSVSQVREVGARLMRLAKGAGILTFLVGHVTKEGTIAGPRVLEHMVDTVLYFETSGGFAYRILRSVKNRFGSTNEIGVFEMNEAGLQEIKNPSAMFLSERMDSVTGSCAVSSLEGTRPILVEIQALVSRSYLSNPRRTTLGVDPNRTALLLAVMEKKWDLPLGDQDVYVNVAGGMRLTEPSADLGIMAAVSSSYLNKTIPRDCLLIGEVGLAGEVRAVSQVEARIKEAKMLGFQRCILPKRNRDQLTGEISGIQVIGVQKAEEILKLLF